MINWSTFYIYRGKILFYCETVNNWNYRIKPTESRSIRIFRIEIEYPFTETERSFNLYTRFKFKIPGITNLSKLSIYRFIFAEYPKSNSIQFIIVSTNNGNNEIEHLPSWKVQNETFYEIGKDMLNAWNCISWKLQHKMVD